MAWTDHNLRTQGVETILIPQPSDDDPNDPLVSYMNTAPVFDPCWIPYSSTSGTNTRTACCQLWPRWQKEAAFWVIFANAIVFAILPGPLIAPATFALAPILGVSLTSVSELSGYQLLVVAALG